MYLSNEQHFLIRQVHSTKIYLFKNIAKSNVYFHYFNIYFSQATLKVALTLDSESVRVPNLIPRCTFHQMQ